MGRTREAQEETRTYEKLISEKDAQLRRLKAEEQQMDIRSSPPPKD